MAETPRRGSLVRDKRNDRVGVLMDVQGRQWWLRPQGGGREWIVPAEKAVPLTQEEALRAKVAEANRRSRSAA